MKNQKGFSLIELLIVVAIIGIIAAIAIPSLLAARVNANHSATIADHRTVNSSNALYQAQTICMLGFAPAPVCLNQPLLGPCLGPAYMGPTFADPVIGAGPTMTWGQPKSGYYRFYEQGAVLPPCGDPPVVTTEVDSYCYQASAVTQNRTGVRSFGVDDSGVIGDTNGPVDCCAPDPVNPGGFVVDTAMCAASR